MCGSTSSPIIYYSYPLGLKTIIMAEQLWAGVAWSFNPAVLHNCFQFLPILTIGLVQPRDIVGGPVTIISHSSTSVRLGAISHFPAGSPDKQGYRHATLGCQSMRWWCCSTIWMMLDMTHTHTTPPEHMRYNGWTSIRFNTPLIVHRKRGALSQLGLKSQVMADHRWGAETDWLPGTH